MKLNKIGSQGLAKAAFCMATSVFAGAAAQAEDVIVPEGSTRVLQSGTYDKIFVNGTCSISDDAVVSCTSLMVASGDVQNVSFTVGENAKLTVTGKGQTYIGYDNGGCTFTLEDGAKMIVTDTAYVRHRIDNNRVSSYLVTINLRQGAIFQGNGTDQALVLGGGSSPASSATTPEGTKVSTLGVTTVVNLDAASALRFSSVQVKYRPDTRINFNGGCISNLFNNTQAAMVKNTSTYSSTINHGTKLYLTSVNGNPIRLHKASHAHAFFNIQAANGSMHFEGNLELDGNADDSGDAQNTLAGTDNLTWYKFNQTSLKTDAVTFKGSVRPKFGAANFFPKTAKILVSKNARLELNGYFQEFAGISGEGCVTNRGTAASLTINNADDSTIGKVCPNVTLVKQGTGSLAVGTVDAATTFLDVQAGSLAVGNLGVFGSLSIDAAAATAHLDTVSADAVGTLALANYTVSGSHSKLPITYTTIAEKKKLAQWPVTLGGVPYTALPLTAYAGSFYLGKLGLILSVW